LKVGGYYTNPHSQHAKNECIYGIIGLDSVLEQVLNAKKVEKKEKILPICYLFPSFATMPLIDYDCMQGFF
jgi:hypothetical protein